MRPIRMRFTVRRARLGVTLAAALLAVFLGSLIQRGDDSSLGERRPVEVEGRPLIVEGHTAFPALEELDDDSSLGERRAIEVEGRPLIVESYSAFPALGDLDG